MNAVIHKFWFRAMASPCEVVICGGTTEAAQHYAGVAEQEVLRIEHKYSRYREDSVVSQINRNAGASGVEVDDETLTLIAIADKLYQASAGRFDITSGVLRRAWQFREARLPLASDIAPLLPLIDWLAVERNGHSVRLPRADMELDFGGFGKEYAADSAARLLQQAGITQGYVNLGGDLRVLGPKADGSPWMLGIQHPRDMQRMIATIPVVQGALATSGDYERFIDVAGQRYCHVLNPRTGFPVSHWRSVSVLAANAVMAGSFSTIAMLLESAGLEFLQKSGLSFLAIDHTGKVWQDNGALPQAS